ncbi:MAG: hypothetical protein V2A79_14710 [Planctomycetota bacterium]
MSNVRYDNLDKVHMKRVYFVGTTTTDRPVGGQAVCYDQNGSTGGTASSLLVVEKPATANLGYFAGILRKGTKVAAPTGKTARQWVEICEPAVGYPGTLVQAGITGSTCTANTTKLGIANGSFKLQAATTSIPAVAVAAQTGSTGIAQSLLVRLCDRIKATKPAKTPGLSPGLLTGVTTGSTVAYTGLTQRCTGTTITTITGITPIKAGILRNGAMINQIISYLGIARIMDLS